MESEPTEPIRSNPSHFAESPNQNVDFDSEQAISSDTNLEGNTPEQAGGKITSAQHDVFEPIEPPVETGTDISGTETVESGFYPIDPRNITLDRIVGLIFTGVVLVGAIVSLVVFFFSQSSIGWLFWSLVGGAVVLVLALTVLSYVWPSIEYRHTRWRQDDQGLEIRRGVFWQHQISVPTARLQHVDVSQGPLQRNFGLGTLTVHTAGTANASVELGGLSFETATALRDELMAQREALNVV